MKEEWYTLGYDTHSENDDHVHKQRNSLKFLCIESYYKMTPIKSIVKGACVLSSMLQAIAVVKTALASLFMFQFVYIHSLTKCTIQSH
jgi:hypothetical protein